MKSLSGAWVLFAAGSAASTPGQTPPPAELQPSSKWQVEYAKSSCIVSRAFGEGAQRTLFGLKPFPNSDIVTLLVVRPYPLGKGARGTASIQLSGGYHVDSADYVSVTANGVRVTTIGVPRMTLEYLAKGESITVKAGDQVSVTVRPTGVGKVLKTLQECEANLLESWGFSREAQAAVAERPKGTMMGLIQPDDYPDAALESGISGTVGFRLRIETDGNVSECAVLEPSGSADLDKATCAIMKKRGRFSPALGRDGNPMWSFTFGWVTWMTEVR